MIQRNCKNCGAPLEHSFNHKCSYCGTLYDFNEPEENTIKVNPEDLFDIKLRNVKISEINHSLILTFDGYKCTMPKIYEYNSKENFYISKVEEYINPPKAGFCIEIPINDLREYGVNYLLWRIEAYGIRYSEINKIKEQIINNGYLRIYGV